MTDLTGYVLAGADDYEVGDNTESTGTTITAYNFEVSGEDKTAWAEIDGSDLPSNASIYRVVLWYYHDSYTKVGKSTTDYRQIALIDTASTVTNLFTSTGTPPSAGWEDIVISAEATLAKMEDAITEDGYITFRWNVGSAEASGSRTWNIRAYEHTGGGTMAAYLVMSYTQPRRRSIVIA